MSTPDINDYRDSTVNIYRVDDVGKVPFRTFRGKVRVVATFNTYVEQSRGDIEVFMITNEVTTKVYYGYGDPNTPYTFEELKEVLIARYPADTFTFEWLFDDGEKCIVK